MNLPPKKKRTLIFYIASFSIQVLSTFILGALFSLWGEINDIFYVLLLYNWNYSLILFLSSLISCIYSGLLVLMSTISSWASKSSYLPKFFQLVFFTLLPILGLLINIVILLLILIAGEGHLKLILYLLEFIFPILLFLGIVALGVIISPIISSLKKIILKSRNNSTLARKSLFQQRFVGVISSAFIISLYIGFTIIPVGVNPSSILAEDIPEKPLIIAHRGAAHISPENTLESIQLAHEIGAAGWEVDVRISIDGFFFLMHDTDLKRTTDVELVYPERVNEEASSFTISELQQLDAGSWFVDRDPYGAIRSERVDAETAFSYREAKIPLLDEIINYTVQNPHLLDIDMKRPSTSHPYASQYEDLLLEKLNLSNLTENVIIKSYKPAAANFTHLLSPGEYSIEEMIGIGAELIDEKYWVPNRKIGEYSEVNIPIMVGVLNSQLRFSQVWLLGVKMVLTDDPDVFINMSTPLRIMKRNLYFPLWIGMSLISYCGGLTYYILREKPRKNVKKHDRNVV